MKGENDVRFQINVLMTIFVWSSDVIRIKFGTQQKKLVEIKKRHLWKSLEIKTNSLLGNGYRHLFYHSFKSVTFLSLHYCLIKLKAGLM